MSEITEERIKEIIVEVLTERGLLEQDIISKIKKSRYGTYVLLSGEEYGNLIKRFGKEDADRKIEKLDNYIGSKGRKYKSHYRTILVWAENDKGGQYEKMDIKKLLE
jgi:hypothetical protein